MGPCPPMSAASVRRSRHLPDAARQTGGRHYVHERLDGQELREMLGEEPAADLLRTTVVASIGPVTAEAAQQLGIQTTVMPTTTAIPALVQSLVDLRGTHPVSGSHGARVRVRKPRHDDARRAAEAHAQTAAAAGRPRCARSCARRSSRPITSSIHSSSGKDGRAPPGRVDAGSVPVVGRRSGARGGGREAGGRRRRHPLRVAVTKGRGRLGRSDPDAPVQVAVRAIKRDVRDLIVVTDVCLCEHVSRALRVSSSRMTQRARRNRERRQRRGTGQGRTLSRRCGRRHRRALRHDGRPRGRHPPRAR